MPQITLQDVQAKQSELAAMIAALAADTMTTITIDKIEIDLNAGERYAGTVLVEQSARALAVAPQPPKEK